MLNLSPPDFYRPDQVGELYLERAGRVIEAGRAYAKRHRIRPSQEDSFRICAFGVDLQVGFCMPGASLFVPGAVQDTQRAIGWIYANLDKLTELAFSMDTHRVFQIFHPSWWKDRNGNPPAPMTPIFHEEVRAGKWIPISHPEECLEYTRKLEAAGRYVLTIWPYHALLGGLSHPLVPALFEASLFHAAARQQPTHFETKGSQTLTENYSVLSPEVTELGGRVVGAFNAPFFQRLMDYDRVYLFGEAKSHCVLWTLNDLRARMKGTDPGLLRKLWILEDAMSPVPAPPLHPLPAHLDFPRLADQAMETFRQEGVHVVKTTDPLDL
jgi:nicotinamidase-related amidase